MVIELTEVSGMLLDAKELANALKEPGKEPPVIYQWKNHLAYFGTVQITQSLKLQLAKSYPTAIIKIYHDMFYIFNREKCAGGTSAKQWDNVLLTANMSADRALQQEYLDYHAKQFQQWPEVSKGFCNADFQQLVIFKNGHQLMLIISIPKGASLDELNPGTTANNPRVDEWNTMMKKYQEGIKGTAPGEAWAFLKRVK